MTKTTSNAPTERAVTYYYAILDESDVCTDVVSLPMPLTGQSQYIEISFLDESLIGQKYDRQTGQFSPIVAGSGYTKDEADARFAPRAHLHEIADVNGLTLKLQALEQGGGEAVNAYTKGETDAKFEAKGTSYSKAESDAKYAPIGAGAAITAQDILTKIKTVDGQNSGLDADMLDGHDTSYFATATQLNGKANTDHAHSEYAPISHNHTYSDVGAAPSIHSHGEYASSNHTHDYAATGHSHTSFDVVNFNQVRCGNQQMLYTGGGGQTIGTNNLDTTLCAKDVATMNGNTFNVPNLVPRNGGAFNLGNTTYRWGTLYCKTAPNVSSDERLKDNIVKADNEKLVDFIKNIDVVNFNFKEDDETKLGVIAQQLQTAQPEIADFLVKEGDNGMLGVSTSDLVFPLIAFVQNAQKEIDELKLQLSELK